MNPKSPYSGPPKPALMIDFYCTSKNKKFRCYEFRNFALTRESTELRGLIDHMWNQDPHSHLRKVGQIIYVELSTVYPLGDDFIIPIRVKEEGWDYTNDLFEIRSKGKTWHEFFRVHLFAVNSDT